MNLMDKLERKLKNCYIANLMNYICLSMAAVYVLDLFGLNASYWFAFNRELILRGQIWRVLTFILIPSSAGLGGLIGFVLHLYFSWFVGTTLENNLGSRKFFLYYLTGTLLNILCGFLFGSATNYYLHYAMFFAFALLYPNHRIMLFFIIPLEMKWLALIDGIYYIYLISGCFFHGYVLWGSLLLILFSLLPIVIFFFPELKLLLRGTVNRIRRKLENRGR